MVALSVGTSTADDAPRSATALASAAEQAFGAHELRRAGELLEPAIQRGMKTPAAPYESACSYARAGDRDRAFAMLDRAVAMGVHDVDEMTADNDLATLRSDARWKPLVSRVTDAHAADCSSKSIHLLRHRRDELRRHVDAERIVRQAVPRHSSRNASIRAHASRDAPAS